MLRDRSYLRKMRAKHIARKKAVCKAIYGEGARKWYKHDGQYSKGKIYCGCNICKYGKHMNLPTVRDMREWEKEKVDRNDYEKCEMLGDMTTGA